MAGQPGRSGGARPGSGPKKKAPEAVAHRDPLQFLIDVMQGLTDPSPSQLKAAIAATQYVHAKKGEGGKKDERGEAAKKAATGKFAAAAPPLKLVRKG